MNLRLIPIQQTVADQTSAVKRLITNKVFMEDGQLISWFFQLLRIDESNIHPKINKTKIIVAENNCKPIGVLVIDPHGVMQVFIKPQFRLKGIGSKLITEAIKLRYTTEKTHAHPWNLESQAFFDHNKIPVKYENNDD